MGLLAEDHQESYNHDSVSLTCAFYTVEYIDV